MNIPTWEESRQAVMIGYADAIHGFISEYEPANIDESEIFRSDLQVLVDDLIQSEAKNCAEHYHRIMRDAVEQAVLKEREACAKLCEKTNLNYALPFMAVEKCAAAIRQRETNK